MTKEEEQALLNLLCRIYRDGGQYIQQHGVQKAAEDAEEIVLQLIRYREEYPECANMKGSAT